MISRSLAVRISFCVTAAFIVGLGLTLLLPTQHAPPLGNIVVHIREFGLQLVPYFYRHWWPYFPIFVLPLGYFILLPWVFSCWFSRPEFMIVWIIAIIGVALSAGFCAIFFVDVYSIRYLVVAFFWPIIFVSASVVRFMPGTNKTIATVSTAFTLYFGITIIASIKATEFHGWRDALADCLLKQQIGLGLKDGLAGYWLARKAVVGSDWKLQIEQIAGGKYYQWGNNSYWLSHSILDIGQPPNFNFVVLSETTRLTTLRHSSVFQIAKRVAPQSEYGFMIARLYST